MKLIYKSNEDEKQLFHLIRLFLDSQKGKTFTMFSARQFFKNIYGIDIDQHDYAIVLDQMVSCDAAKIVPGRGYTEYLIN